MTCIEGNTFDNCISLKQFIIPDTVTSIGAAAFSGCNSLAEILIPKSVTHIKKYAFSYCPSLTGLILPPSINWNGAFGTSIGLSDITIQNGNARVYENAFYDFKQRMKITITAPAVQRMAQSLY